MESQKNIRETEYEQGLENPKTTTTTKDRDIGGLNRRHFLKGSAAALGAGTISTGVAYGQGTNPAKPQVETATSSEGMVVTDHPAASQVGVDVLRDGGNAIDAVVAVQLAMNVVQPQSSGIGGGGFMVTLIGSSDLRHGGAISNSVTDPVLCSPCCWR